MNKEKQKIYSIRLGENDVQILDDISFILRTNRSSLIRQGIQMVFEKAKEDLKSLSEENYLENEIGQIIASINLQEKE